MGRECFHMCFKNYSVRESGGEKNVHTVYLYLDVYV